LTIIVQELDGSFPHTVQIDDILSKHDLQCHSKGRRQKRKKIPLCTGEEVTNCYNCRGYYFQLEIDLTNMDPDSPVLWMRVDPELLLVRRIELRQPVYQWEYQLKYEKDVLAQLQSLDTLPRFPSPQTRQTLIDAIENETIFYRYILNYFKHWKKLNLQITFKNVTYKLYYPVYFYSEFAVVRHSVLPKWPINWPKHLWVLPL
jgi:transcription initiation factor TFIID subunit 2